GAGARKGVEVRVLFWAPFPSLQTTTKVQKHPKKPAQAGFFVACVCPLSQAPNGSAKTEITSHCANT
ncbi:MAG: hypothetical protein AAGC59_10315, partial [Brucella pseudogrignonensis]